MRYFAYGSNMHRARLEARVGAVVDRGLVTLVDYRHGFQKLGNDGSAKGTIVAASAELVHGVMYELDGDQLVELAKWEGGYRRVEVAIDGDAVVTFEALRLYDGLRPTNEYLDHYVAGMVEHGFPRDYIDLIVRQSGLVKRRA